MLEARPGRQSADMGAAFEGVGAGDRHGHDALPRDGLVSIEKRYCE
jgi:hypothetical protein